jgi:hypothetical protein
MGYRVGYLSGLRGEQQEVAAVGVTFPDDEKNAALWKRWMGYLKLDMWLIFFGGAMIGMYLPIILMRQMVLVTGQKPTQANVPTFVANALDQQYGRWLFYSALFVGFLILFDTQLGIFEALVRNITDAVNMSPRLQQAIAGDPAPLVLPVHAGADRRDRPVPAVLPAGQAGADLGQHVELRGAYLSIHADVPELQAAKGGQAQTVGLRGVGAELPVLRVLLRQLRLRPVHRGRSDQVLTVAPSASNAVTVGRCESVYT